MKVVYETCTDDSSPVHITNEIQKITIVFFVDA